MTMSDIYKTLSSLDLSKMTEKKMGLTYLSWAHAWGVLMSHYPSSTYEILDTVSFDDGTKEVWVSATVDGHTRKMWLPVMDNRNNAVPNPNARQISDSRMRCLVKCLSLFGLGLYIYQGEDLPSKPTPTATPDISGDQLTTFRSLVDSGDCMSLEVFLRGLPDDVQIALFNSAPKGGKSHLKDKVRKMQSEAVATSKAYADGIKEAIKAQDLCGLIQYKSELDDATKRLVAPLLTHEELDALKNVKGE